MQNFNEIGKVALDITVDNKDIMFVYAWPSVCVFHKGDEKVASNEIPFSA